MNFRIIALFGVLAPFIVAPAAPAEHGGGRESGASFEAQPTLSPGETCFGMKQRVNAVMTTGGAGRRTVDNSGSTALAEQAKRQVRMGDEACARGATGVARRHYQQAIVDFTSFGRNRARYQEDTSR